MGIVSIEEAVLGFVRRVKDDPGVSALFRDALHELEVLLDPHAAEQQAQAGDGTQTEQPAPDPGATVEQPAPEPGTDATPPPPEPGTDATPPPPEQAPQVG